MMLFADSAIMPSLKLNNKKRMTKKVPVRHEKVLASLGKNDYQKEMATALSEAEENLSVSNGVHLKKSIGEKNKPGKVLVLGKRKASRDAEAALQLHYKDGQEEIPARKQQSEVKKAGASEGQRAKTNKNGSTLIVDTAASKRKSEETVRSYTNGTPYKQLPGGKIEPTLKVDDMALPPPQKKLKTLQSNDKAVGDYQETSKNSRTSLVLKKASKKLNRVSDIPPADNYVRRMASLNASACVSALMEPEKKTFTKAVRKPEASLKQFSGQCGVKSSNGIEEHKEEDSLTEIEPTRSSTPSSESSMSSSDSQSMGYASSDFEIQSSQMMGTLLALLAQESNGEDEIPYNRLGLLYNGDTLYPWARVFYNSDTDLTLPPRIIPKVFPSRDVFVSTYAQKALLFKSVGKKKKAAKGNNGWMPLGEAIKVIEHEKDGHSIIRKFYAGIRRNGGKEVICVRDNIVVRAGGDERGDKPYVAKIASIWRETAGQLMMTVFWYYRPDELDSATTQSSVFQKDELLASQHHDDNSVACIEDKCHILGVSQYCRYNAYMKAKTSGNLWVNGKVIPPVPCLPATSTGKLTTQYELLEPYRLSQQYSVGTNSVSKTILQGAFNFVDPDIDTFPGFDPKLVFLCYRGYNHCVGKLSCRSFK